MRKILVLGLLSLLLVTAWPARADYHGACAGTASASGATLGVSGGSFEFSGFATCTGADLTISSLVVADLFGGPNLGTGPAVSCSASSLGPCRATGIAPVPSAGSGFYKVSFNITATGSWIPGGAPFTYNTSRTFTFLYNGVGQPVPYGSPVFI